MRPVDILKEMVSKVGPSVNLKICTHCFKTEKGGMYGCLAVWTGVQTEQPCLKEQFQECPVNPMCWENLRRIKADRVKALKEVPDGSDKVS